MSSFMLPRHFPAASFSHRYTTNRDGFLQSLMEGFAQRHAHFAQNNPRPGFERPLVAETHLSPRTQRYKVICAMAGCGVPVRVKSGNPAAKIAGRLCRSCAKHQALYLPYPSMAIATIGPDHHGHWPPSVVTRVRNRFFVFSRPLVVAPSFTWPPSTACASCHRCCAQEKSTQPRDPDTRSFPEPSAVRELLPMSHGLILPALVA